MRYVSILAFVALSFAAACATQPAKVPPPEAAQPAATRPERSGSVPIVSRGRSCNSAVIVAAMNEHDGVAEENAWIAENYPGATKNASTVTICDHKPVHKID